MIECRETTPAGDWELAEAIANIKMLRQVGELTRLEALALTAQAHRAWWERMDRER